MLTSLLILSSSTFSPKALMGTEPFALKSCRDAAFEVQTHLAGNLDCPMRFFFGLGIAFVQLQCLGDLHTLLIFSSTDMAPIFARAMTSAAGAEEDAVGCAAGTLGLIEMLVAVWLTLAGLATVATALWLDDPAHTQDWGPQQV